MQPRNLLCCLAAMLALECAAAALDAPHPGKNKVVLRGQPQDVYFVPAPGSGAHPKVIYAPGDGGWRGFGVTIAEEMARAGYDVYGLDTRRYLQSFANSSLTPADIAQDYRALAEWARPQTRDKLLIAGWSEGAGLAMVAAAQPANHDLFAGVVAIGATERNILAWRWSDLVAEATKTLPREPTFATADYIGRVAPLALFMIASTRDEYVSTGSTNQLFAKAGNPKRLVMIDAGDHKFSGHTGEFFRTLAQALEWVRQNSQ